MSLQSWISGIVPTRFQAPLALTASGITGAVLAGVTQIPGFELAIPQAASLFIGVPLAIGGGVQVARTLYNHITTRKPPVSTLSVEARRASLASTLADIDNNFDILLARLMLTDEKHLVTQLRIYREEYDKLKTTLEKHAKDLVDTLNDEWRIVANLAEAFDITLASPDPIDDKAQWDKVFKSLDAAHSKFLPDDWAALMQKRDEIIPKLLAQRITARTQSEQLGRIITTEFPEMERKATDAFRTHRTLVDREDKKLHARQALHGSNDVAYALLARGEELHSIAADFIAGFYGIVSDVEARLNAATVSEHPQLDTATRSPATLPKITEARTTTTQRIPAANALAEGVRQ